MSLTGKRLQLALALTGAVAWILQGYDQALMNGLLTLPSFTATFPSINTSTPELKAKHSTLEGLLQTIRLLVLYLQVFRYCRGTVRSWRSNWSSVLLLLGRLLWT
jgi:hypothetical protein